MLSLTEDATCLDCGSFGCGDLPFQIEESAIGVLLKQIVADM